MSSKLCPCPICARPMEPHRQLCVFCHQAGHVAPDPDRFVTPPPVAAPPQQPPPAVLPVKRSGGTSIGGILTALSIAAIWFMQSPMMNRGSDFEIRVRTSPSSPYSGSYMVVAPGGANSSHSVEGSGAATYPASGASIVSAVFQKKDAEGVLTVELWKGEQLVKTESTVAAYGVVSIAER